MVDPTMYLISRTHHLCESRKYAFNVLSEYSIITHELWSFTFHYHIDKLINSHINDL